jgi:hypothetical protein
MVAVLPAPIWLRLIGRLASATVPEPLIPPFTRVAVPTEVPLTKNVAVPVGSGPVLEEKTERAKYSCP